MYAEFFGLRELPFNNTPDPRYFFSTPDHEEALASLIYAVKERKGFVLLTGEVGAGKTLVTRLMLRHFGSAITFANINHAVQSARDLMESLCTEFELPIEPDAGNAQLVRTLHDFLLAKFSQNVPVVLVLDEAQNLPTEAFEQLRMIGNLEADDAKLLQIAIVGQPELQRLFQSPQLRQLRQRIFRSFHLPALDRKLTEGYIRYRLSVAAARDLEVFTSSAVDRIFSVSNGLPRLINAVCDNAMLSAYSGDRRRIDADFVTSVVAQMMPTPDAHALQMGQALTAETESPRVVWPSAAPPCPSARASAAPKQIAPARQAPLAQETSPSPRMASPVPAPPDSRVPADAAAVHSSLDRLAGQAKQIIARGEAVARDLQQREQRVRELSANVTGVAKQLCDLLARLQSASTDCRRERRDADDTTDRLATQTRDSRRLLTELERQRATPSPLEGPDQGGRVVAQPETFVEGRARNEGWGEGRNTPRQMTRAVPPPPSVRGNSGRSSSPPSVASSDHGDVRSPSPSKGEGRGEGRELRSPMGAPRLVTSASAPAAAVAPLPNPVPHHDTDEFQRILHETQESLATLRRLARPTVTPSPISA